MVWIFTFKNVITQLIQEIPCFYGTRRFR